MKANIELKQSRDFGEIISDCIVFIRQNWKSLLKTYFVFCGFFMAGLLFFSLMQRARLTSLNNDSITTENYSAYSKFGFSYFMILLFGFLNIISATLCTLSYIALFAQTKQAPSISAVWIYYKYYFWRTIGHFLLLFLIFFAGMLVVAIPISILGGGLGNSFVVGIVILVFVLIPLIYFVTVFYLFFPAVIIENGGFGYAFSRCFRLIKGKWWNTFGVVVVAFIIFYSGYLLITVPFTVITGGSNIIYIPYHVSLPIVFIYKALLSTYQVFNIVPLIASAITYFSYAEEKESIGLLERIETLGATEVNIEPENEAY